VAPLHYADSRLSQDDAGGTAKAPLSERAQTLIDALAMRDALADTDASPDPRAYGERPIIMSTAIATARAMDAAPSCA
jgi:hypothetical protein